MEKLQIISTNSSNIHTFGMCGFNNLKHEGYRKKVEWLKHHYTVDRIPLYFKPYVTDMAFANSTTF